MDDYNLAGHKDCAIHRDCADVPCAMDPETGYGHCQGGDLYTTNECPTYELSGNACGGTSE